VITAGGTEEALDPVRVLITAGAGDGFAPPARAMGAEDADHRTSLAAGVKRIEA
jgi:hypothetical protein